MRNAWSSSKVVHSKQFSNHSLPLRFCCACYVDTDGFCCTVTFWDTPKSNDTARLKRSVVSTQQRKVGNQTKHSRGERKIKKKSACSKPRQHSNIHIDTREKESLKKTERRNNESPCRPVRHETEQWGDIQYIIYQSLHHLRRHLDSNTFICYENFKYTHLFSNLSSTLKWTQTTGLEPTRRV